MRIKRYLLIAITVLATATGVLTSFGLFDLLKQKGLQAKTHPKEAASTIADKPASPPSTIAYSTSPKPHDTSTSSVRSATPSVLQKAAINIPHLVREEPTDVPALVIATLLVIFVAFTLLARYFTLPALSTDMHKNMDPSGLTELLAFFTPDIEQLGNPRKIKRFSNKLRFQYYYLSEKGLTDAAHLQQLVRVLLQLEEQSLMSIPSGFLSPSDPFGKFKALFITGLKATLDEKFIQVAYALNKDA